MRRRAAGAPLDLSHRRRLVALLAAHPSPLSESSFANLYLFRRTHDYRVVEGDTPFLTGRTYDGERHAHPLQALTPATVDLMLEQADCIYPVGEDGPEIASQLDLDCDWREADSDYVYEAARLAVLAGARTKRGQARDFETYAPSLDVLDDGATEAARAVLEGWLADVGRPAGHTDHAACVEALAMRAALGLDGVVVRSADGAPFAFLLASRSSDGGRIVHFAKGRRAHDGVYPWMFSRYAAAQGSGRINFEQDLGNPGFAQAKRSFAPSARLRKYRLRRRR